MQDMAWWHATTAKVVVSNLASEHLQYTVITVA